MKPRCGRNLAGVNVRCERSVDLHAYMLSLSLAMNAKARNMLEAVMPEPPSVTLLLSVLLDSQDSEVNAEAEVDPNFGDLYEGGDALARNTARMQACVKDVLTDFNAVCRKKGTEYDHLDRFFDQL